MPLGRFNRVQQLQQNLYKSWGIPYLKDASGQLLYPRVPRFQLAGPPGSLGPLVTMVGVIWAASS